MDERYKTLAELKAAYDKGEVPRTDSVEVDNDETTVYVTLPDEGAECVFRMAPDELLEQALDLLGIPHEHV